MENNQPLEEQTNLIPRGDIEELLKEYGLPLHLDSEHRLYQRDLEKLWGMPYHVAMLCLPIDMQGLHNPSRLKVAEMLLALKARKGEATSISFDKATNTAGKAMPVRQTFDLSSQGFNYGLMLLCDAFLRRQNGDTGDEHQPLGEAELEAIIAEEKLLLATDFSEAEAVGYGLTNLLCTFNRFRLFEGCKKRKVFSFLYDWCLLQGVATEDKGEGFRGDVGKEKADWIRYRIDAYDIYIDKMRNKRYPPFDKNLDWDDKWIKAFLNLYGGNIKIKIGE